MNGYTEQLLKSGEQLLAQGARPRAIGLFEQAVKQAPDDNQVQLRVATAYERHGALFEAVRAYRRLADLFDVHGRPDKALQLRARADHVHQVLEAMVDIDLTPEAEMLPAATVIFRAPAPASAGFLAFCLGVVVAIAPVAAPEVGDVLSEATAAPSHTNAGLDGRTRAAHGMLPSTR